MAPCLIYYLLGKKANDQIWLVKRNCLNNACCTWHVIDPAEGHQDIEAQGHKPYTPFKRPRGHYVLQKHLQKDFILLLCQFLLGKKFGGL